MANTEKVYLTENGLAELQAELENLKTVKRPENIEALKDARALGDLSENAEYDAARNEQAIIESRITELEKILETAEVISDSEINTDTVSIGTAVKLEFIDDEETDTYYIVGRTEADPFENKISNESPIAQAILGKKAGEVATVKCDSDDYQVKIVEIMAQ
ncbi:MAG: transcription elongation factor GreA [Bacilli bacterium]|nr:transcription elongation factor GreA [Bacilli bacterium]